MVEYLPQFLGLGAIALLASMSPGADFAVVVAHALRYSRRVGIYTAVGVGCGILIHVFYTLVGIGFIISQSVILFSFIKYAGAAYLIYIGYQALKSKPQKIQIEPNHKKQKKISIFKAFGIGFATNVLNPKATLFFLSLFTQFISVQTPLYVQITLGAEVALIVGLWFVIVAYAFSSDILKRTLTSVAHWIDRAMGVGLIALGVKVATSKQ